MHLYQKISIVIFSSILLSCSGGGLDEKLVQGTWFYSTSECDGDETSLQGATLEINFKANGNGTRTFTTNDCVVTNEFRWVLDGNTFLLASTDTTCDPVSCSHDMQIGGVDFTLDCSDNFEDVWEGPALNLDGEIATEDFQIQNLSCKNTYINPDLE